jgi:hypothetical protein
MITLDGQPFAFGERVSLGPHRLAIRCPKADSFETNLFIWYGSHDLGRLELRRSQASLRVEVVPPAPHLTLAGPEWHQVLTNSSGLTASVPTDTYRVTADYGRFSVEKTVEVLANSGASCQIAPEVGGLAITASRPGTGYELYRIEGEGRETRLVERSELPTTLPVLQAGKYRVHCDYKGIEKDWPVEIVRGQTNALEVDFPLGTVVLETTPPGATVRDELGKERGATPLTLTEVPVGRWRGQLDRADYLSVKVDLEVQTSMTVTFRTNLVTQTYANAMEAARRALEGSRRDYQAAITALTAALSQEPGNAAAAALLKEAQVGQYLQQAESKAGQGDFAGALQQAEAALATLPEHAGAKKLAAQYRQGALDKQAKDAEALRQAAAAARERWPRDCFDQMMKKTLNSSLFDQQEIKVKGKSAEIEAKIIRALTNEQPAFMLLTQQQLDGETFLIRTTAKATSGWRRCDLVGGQTTDGEVTILFKIFEYAYLEEFSLRVLLKMDDEKDMVPVHPSRVPSTKSYLLRRRAEGIGLVHNRIREIGGE